MALARPAVVKAARRRRTLSDSSLFIFGVTHVFGMNTKSARGVALPPVASILLAVFSVQGGATIAKGLFAVIGPAGTASVRIGLSALILLAVFRPPVHRFTAAQWRAVVPYGVSM